MLRREGLYSSHLTKWRRERKDGILDGPTPQKRGPKSTLGVIQPVNALVTGDLAGAVPPQDLSRLRLVDFHCAWSVPPRSRSEECHSWLVLNVHEVRQPQYLPCAVLNPAFSNALRVLVHSGTQFARGPLTRIAVGT